MNPTADAPAASPRPRPPPPRRPDADTKPDDATDPPDRPRSARRIPAHPPVQRRPMHPHPGRDLGGFLTRQHRPNRIQPLLHHRQATSANPGHPSPERPHEDAPAQSADQDRCRTSTVGRACRTSTDGAHQAKQQHCRIEQLRIKRAAPRRSQPPARGLLRPPCSAAAAPAPRGVHRRILCAGPPGAHSRRPASGLVTLSSRRPHQ